MQDEERALRWISTHSREVGKRLSSTSLVVRSRDFLPGVRSRAGIAAQNLGPKADEASNARSEPDALLAELEQARAELQRAELKSRTYLVRTGILDQTRVDLAVALKRIAAGRAEGES